MLGTSRPNPYVGETNGAGVMGSRGCEPLAWQRPFRIARAQQDWTAPRFVQQFVGFSPVQILPQNNNRGTLALTIHLTDGGAGGDAVYLSPVRQALLSSPPTFYFAVIANVAGQLVKASFTSQYQGAGGLVNCAWYALMTGTGSAFVAGWEQDYYG